MVPSIAVIANAPAPYRLSLHRRLIAGLPETKIYSIFTHDFPQKEQAWDFTGSEDINPVRFGVGESCADAPRPASAAREWKRGGRIISWLKEQNIRAVLMCGYNDVGRQRVISWCSRRQVPLFMVADSNIHGERARGAAKLVKQALVRWVVNSADAFLPCGSYGATYFRKYGAREEQIASFPYEPDYEVFQNVPEAARRDAASKFGLDASRRRLVFVGRMVPEKRPDLALDAFKAIASDRPDWDLLMVGAGPMKDELVARTPESLRGRVHWTGFVRDPRELAALYHLSDALVLPSSFEPWGVVVNEAASVPLAMCVSHVVGAAPEFVKDGVNGRVFLSEDLAALVAGLREITDASKIDRYKAGSATVLAEWRRNNDPAVGLRHHLHRTGVLAGAGVTSSCRPACGRSVDEPIVRAGVRSTDSMGNPGASRASLLG